MNNLLIAKNDRKLLQEEEMYLKNQGYCVESVTSGSSALLKIKNNRYDVLILDAQLDEIDGFSICLDVRKISSVPIIITSCDDKKDLIKAYRIGADDYMSMPYKLEELGIRVKSNINRYFRLTGSKAKIYDIINYKDIKIDTRSRQIWIGKKEVKVRCKQFDILTYLINNQTRVLTREEIYEGVWGECSFGDTSTVTVHINTLRDNLKKYCKNDYIDTIWGVGYRLK